MSTLLLIYVHGDNVTEAQHGHTEGTGEPGGLQVLYIQYRQEKSGMTKACRERGRERSLHIHTSTTQPSLPVSIVYPLPISTER